MDNVDLRKQKLILDTNIINNKNCCGDIFGNIKN